jgi:Site-specific recombinases, DNA invertase Pin homologs
MANQTLMSLVVAPMRLRCAIYTRKSSEEGLEQDFNSLDAQREACEAFIASQKHEGWSILPEMYDDGGFSGGTIERPAFQRLLMDVGEEKSMWWSSTRSTA